MVLINIELKNTCVNKHNVTLKFLTIKQNKIPKRKQKLTHNRKHPRNQSQSHQTIQITYLIAGSSLILKSWKHFKFNRIHPPLRQPPTQDVKCHPVLFRKSLIGCVTMSDFFSFNFKISPSREMSVVQEMSTFYLLPANLSIGLNMYTIQLSEISSNRISR